MGSNRSSPKRFSSTGQAQPSAEGGAAPGRDSAVDSRRPRRLPEVNRRDEVHLDH